jgi:hypothetical protein
MDVTAALYSEGALLLAESAGDGKATKLLLAARNHTLPPPTVNISSLSGSPWLREVVSDLQQHIPGASGGARGGAGGAGQGQQQQWHAGISVACVGMMAWAPHARLTAPPTPPPPACVPCVCCQARRRPSAACRRPRCWAPRCTPRARGARCRASSSRRCSRAGRRWCS